MASPAQGGQSPLLEPAQRIQFRSNAWLESMSDLDVADPPQYTRYNEELPTYQQANEGRSPVLNMIHPRMNTPTLEEQCRIDDCNRQQELQLLLAVLCSICLTVLLVEAVPIRGEPTSAMEAIRMYGLFASAFSLCIVLATMSWVAKLSLASDKNAMFFGSEELHLRRNQSRYQALQCYCIAKLISAGPSFMYGIFLCFGLGLLDLFWQLYPALSVTVSAVAFGVFGGGPVFSFFTQGALSKSWFRRSPVQRVVTEDLGSNLASS